MHSEYNNYRTYGGFIFSGSLRLREDIETFIIHLHVYYGKTGSQIAQTLTSRK